MSRPIYHFALALSLALLCLTPRSALATNRTVTNLNDSGTGSLRQTILDSISGDTIDFAVTGTITLTSGELVIGRSITINGPGASILNVARSSAGGTLAFRIFRISNGTTSGPTVSISGLTISNGDMTNGTSSNQRGAGIFNDHSNLTLTNCVVTGNTAPDIGGGGIYNFGNTAGSASLTMVNCTVGANNARGFGQGGGIFSVGNSGGASVLTLTNCTFSQNKSYNGGGIALQGAGNSTVTNCTFSGNEMNNVGGAILLYSGASLVITNCTISNNKPLGSGGSGGGIYGGCTLRNTLVAGNTAQTGPDVDDAGIPFTSQGHNLIGKTDGSTGWVASDLTGTISAPLDPLLSPLQDNGGLTQTMALQPSSAARDAGDDSVLGLPLNLTTDQRGPGFPRKLNTHVDIGAFEFDYPPQRGPTFTITTNDDHDDGICGVVDCTLREAINAANAASATNTIISAAGVTGTIQLNGALPNLSTNINVQGPGANALTVRRNTSASYRIFTITNGMSSGPTVSISGLTIANGQVSGSGGGILSDHAALTLTNCIVSGNNASAGGGGIYNAGNSGSANVTLSNSTLSGNNGDSGGSGTSGGAILNYAGALTAINSTFSGNSAFSGGAIYNLGGGTVASVTLRSCTVGGNSGGGIRNDNFGSSPTLTLSNTLLKTGSSGANFLNTSGTITSQGHNLSNDAAGGDNSTGPGGFLNATGDIRNTDPMLDTSLKNNGGPTQTIALLSGSPAINNGDPNAPPQDQRYYLRSGAPDIGAFEFGGTLAPISAVSRKTHGTAGTFDINLPLTGPVGVECRQGGGTNSDFLQVIMTFPIPVTVTSASAAPDPKKPGATGSVSGLTVTGSQVTVNLAGVSNAQTLTITLTNVSDGVNTNSALSIPIGVLLGDVNGDGFVLSGDYTTVRKNSGNSVDPTTFRYDINADGFILSGDYTSVRKQSGTQLP